MFSTEARRVRFGRRARRRPELGAPEHLERRELLTWSGLGFSLPDLTIAGTAAPVAAYGGQLGVQLVVQNLGSSSVPEPFSQEPGAHSTADSAPVRAEVFLSTRPRFGPGAVSLGFVEVPGLRQNSFDVINTTFNMPLTQLRGFPGSGGTVFAFFRIDTFRESLDFDRTNNVTRNGVPILIAAPLPDLQAIALSTPTVMQPGDLVQPAIKVENLGTTNPNLQGPLTVELVASTDQNFGPGDQVLATYTIDSLPPLALVPLRTNSLGEITLNDPDNVVTLQGPIVHLPQTAPQYFIGVIVDPFNTIREIREIGQPPRSELFPIRRVGPPIAGLPPAGMLTTPPSEENVFPVPAFGPISTVGNFSTDNDGGTAATQGIDVTTLDAQQARQFLFDRFFGGVLPPTARPSGLAKGPRGGRR